MPNSPTTFSALMRRKNQRWKHSTGLSRSKRGYTRAFYRFRDWYLAQHPECVRCGWHGSTVNPLVVDHIKPMSQGGAACDEDNAQTLCRSCNSRKARLEDDHTKHATPSLHPTQAGPTESQGVGGGRKLGA